MFTINEYGTKFTVMPCTAIASCDAGDETKRQDALLVIGGEVDFLVFCWEMPETEEEWRDMCADGETWEEVHEENALNIDVGVRYTREELRRHAGPLYDGGWRKGDAAELAQEYGYSQNEAAAVCERLAEIEEDEKNNK